VNGQFVEIIQCTEHQIILMICHGYITISQPLCRCVSIIYANNENTIFQ